jgi:hypothetical protein
MRKRILGEEHPDILTSMDVLSWAYGQQGCTEEATGERVGEKEVDLSRRASHIYRIAAVLFAKMR